MTAEVFSVDGARVSARKVLPGSPSTGDLLLELDSLRRLVDREARAQFGDVPRKRLVYLTVEEIVDEPMPVTAA